MTANPTAVTDDPSVFKATAAMNLLAEAMKDDKEKLIEKVRGVYCFKVKNSSGKEGMWVINAKTGSGSVTYNGKGIVLSYFYITNSKLICYTVQKSNLHP